MGSCPDTDIDPNLSSSPQGAFLNQLVLSWSVVLIDHLPKSRFVQIEPFSIDCCKTKTKTKLITKANQMKGKYITLKSRRELKTETSKLPKARENAGDQVVVGFSFVSDWLRD